MTMQLMFKYILEITCFFMFPKDLTLHLEDIDLIPCEVMYICFLSIEFLPMFSLGREAQ